MQHSDNNKGTTQLKDDQNRLLRSSSPAVKRPASDMGAQDRVDHHSTKDVDMPDTNNTASSPVNPQSQSTMKPQNSVKRQKSNEPNPAVNSHSSNPKAVAQTAPMQEDNNTNAGVQAASTPNPSIDEQVRIVSELVAAIPQDKQKGYLVSAKWLRRVQARSSQPPIGTTVEKSATEGEIGPLDNSDIAMVVEDSGELKDEAGEPFVFLRPGLALGEDFQVLPQEAWDLVLQWYGIARTSPVITRYAHALTDDNPLETQYELNPPVFTFLKVVGQQSAQTQKDVDLPPPRMLSSVHNNYMIWLREAKALVHTDVKTKVKVWRILGGIKSQTASGILTPIPSRSTSPAPGTEIVASAGSKMLLDVHNFALLVNGEERQLIEHKDQTADTKYNVSIDLKTIGLGGNAVIVLEEETSSADVYASERIQVSLKGIPKPKGLTVPARTASPAPPTTGIMTRGRPQRGGRPKGIVGLTNLGNTCYMNSALQCIRSVEELTQYFLTGYYKKDLNFDNPLGHHGEVAKAYGKFIDDVYSSSTAYAPSAFKRVVGKHGPSFAGYGQQDSQEFLAFLLDGLQEDLNRIKKKPYIEKPDSTDEMVNNEEALKAFADRNWNDYKARNDSVVTDLFAGMYKSTLTCPVCDKVSIVFDPFSNLTLQLPIENNWSKEILYFPLYAAPFRVDVDIDKNASILDMKKFIGQRTKFDAAKMICAEAYKNKFFKIFDNNEIISEAGINANDVVCIYELSEKPTNYNPDKKKKFSQFTYGNKDHDPQVDADSPAADSLIVPVFHRVHKSNSLNRKTGSFFGHPSYVVLSRDDRSSYDLLLKKVLGQIVGMTTLDMFTKDVSSTSDDVTGEEDSDTLLVGENSSTLPSPSASAISVQGEDSLVNVSMRDAEPDNKDHPDSRSERHARILKSSRPLPKQFYELFDIQFVHTDEGIPTGWNNIQDNGDFKSVKDRVSEMERRSKPARVIDEGYDSVTDEADSPPSSTQPGSDSASESGASGPQNTSDDDSLDLPEVSDLTSGKDTRGVSKHQKKKVFSRKGKKIVGRAPRKSPKPAPQPRVALDAGNELILPGDAIVIDWTDGAFDGLFGANEEDKEDMRGLLTHDRLELFDDEELAAKRVTRNSRKKNGITLQDCLNEYGKTETLSEQNAWYCPRCKEHRRADKKFELWKVPDILVMHLKRFSSSRNFRDKLELKVEYPVEGLDLTDMVRDQSDGKSLMYDLIAVDNHYGGLGGGHYTALARNPVTGNWYDYNDSHVGQVRDADDVVTKSAYLLFYRRRQDVPLGGPYLEKLLADPEFQEIANSREVSPSGEGQRLGDSSHNGSSSASAGRAHLVGDGGPALNQPQKRSGLSREVELPDAHSIDRGVEDEDLPAYSVSNLDMIPDDDDEGISMDPSQPWDNSPGWGFNRINQPTNSAADDTEFIGPLLRRDSDNSAAAASSTGVMGGSERSFTAFDDVDNADVMQLDRYRVRENAPPPQIQHIPWQDRNEEEEELEVKELRIDSGHDEPNS